MRSLLITAAACLCWAFPAGWLFPKKTKLVAFDRMTWPSTQVILVMFLDLLRSASLAYVLQHTLVRLEGRFSMGYIVDDIILALVFGFCAVCQTFGKRDEDFVLAPVGFVIAAVFFILGPFVGTLAAVLGIGTAAAMRGWEIFFVGVGVTSATLGALFHNDDWIQAVMIGVACLMPLLVAVLTGRHLGFPKK